MKPKWKSYGYYYGDGKNAPGVDECFADAVYSSWHDTNIAIASDYMKYCDVNYKGTSDFFNSAELPESIS